MQTSTLSQLYQTALQDLRAAGVESPELDARVLLINAAEISVEEFYLDQHKIIKSKQADIFKAYITRRVNREPVAKIIGNKGFWKHDFHVNSHTLDPRPDSELIIENALKFFPDKTSAINILDLGTGSGCLLLSLVDEFKNSNGVAVDISQEALAIAQKNAINLALQDRVEFIQSNWFENISGMFDLIVSNPPYIPKADIEHLEKEVKEYDPYLALDGGLDGLDPYRYLAENLKKFLKIGGYAIIEFGIGQAQELKKIFNQYNILAIEKDLAKLERVIILERKS
jgi:release factor glutamine methyltransferase